MLVSVHIPKTGGSSFRTLLENHFKDRLLLDYADTPFEYNNFVRNSSAVLKIFNPPDLTKYDCIHGHFLPVKYYLLKDKTTAIWLREPVEMLVSLYYYIQRKISPEKRKVKKYMGDINLSLEDFCKITHFHNIYAKYLWGISLEKFDFIGITENYTQNLKLFEKCCNVNLTNNLIVENVNPEKNSLEERYDISDKLRKQIRYFNYKDVLIYQQALELNKRLEQRYL
ncbi:MAG: hypothetical protein RIT27_2312 [Pseudomonadota bacterium]|jgi:hypothetical protein